ARCCRCQGNQGGSCTDQAAGGACSGRAGSAEEEAQLQAAARTRSAARKNRRSREKHRGVASGNCAAGVLSADCRGYWRNDIAPGIAAAGARPVAGALGRVGGVGERPVSWADRYQWVRELLEGKSRYLTAEPRLGRRPPEMDQYDPGGRVV